MEYFAGSNKWGLCRFFVCYSCNFTVCGRRVLLPPSEVFDHRCPSCNAMYWYIGPPKFIEIDKCTCYVQSCNNCGNILCSCTLESVSGRCLLCGVSDGWNIIPPELFSEKNINREFVNP